jgi:uncharacterized membrane protein YkoI
MFKVLAVAIAIAATTTVAGAQAPAASKAAVKTTTTASATAKRHRRTVKKETQADLQKAAKISEADARATALKQVPGGTVKSEELEREHGKLIYSYDISVPGKSGIDEVNVNAIDGSVVAKSHETPKTEKAEAKKEAKEKKTTK